MRRSGSYAAMQYADPATSRAVQSGKALIERAEERWLAARKLAPERAALPDAHQVHDVDAARWRWSHSRSGTPASVS